MKKIILSLFIISSFVACKRDLKNDTKNRDIHLLNDSAVFTNSTFSDTQITVKAGIIPSKSINETSTLVKKKKYVRAKNAVSAPVYNQQTAVPTVSTPPQIPENTNVGTNTAKTGTTDNSGTVSNTPQVEKKKGWSKAAQGAAIGGVTGAVGGAILSKKKGLGAVVGGVVGAAGGYIIGKKMDKNNNKLIFE